MSTRSNKSKVHLAFSRRFNPPKIWTSDSDWWRGLKPETITLSEPDFKAFMEMIDHPPQVNEKMKSLMAQKDIPWKK